MKIVSDFDGVLTDLTQEGLRVRELFRSELLNRTGTTPAEVDGILDRAEETLGALPHRFGWKMKGRLSAYSNEDLFVRAMGLAFCLDEWAEQDHGGLVGEMKAALVRGGCESYHALSNHAYSLMLGETHAGKIHPLEATTPAFIHDLVEQGHEIVVVSNSATDRILEILNEVGIGAVPHEENPKAKIRVRGGARKFELGDEPRGFQNGEYWLDVNRPSYLKILTEERPDVVIGDVFSLDLGLPLFLSRTEAPFRGLRLCLRKRHYTPDWSLDLALNSREPTATLHLLQNLADLLPVMRG